MALGTKVLECCGVKAELEATCPGSIVEIDCKKTKRMVESISAGCLWPSKHV
jgi:hypothetical protein